MSWLELDDGILRHPKFIRAVRLAGSEAIHLWLGLRAYCGQLLTDGSIPADMIDAVEGPAKEKARATALAALIKVELLEVTDQGLQMHDYLDWSSSKEEVESRRASNRDRKRRSRGTTDGVTAESQRSHTVTTHGLRAESQTPARADPLRSPPLPSAPLQTGEGSGAPPSEKPAPSEALSAPATYRAPFRPIRVGIVTPAFLAVYEAYPRRDVKTKAAQVFAEIADDYPGGEVALCDAILAWFKTGVLKRHPYAGENKFRPFLETVLAERRWQDDQSAPDEVPIAAAGGGGRAGPVYREIPRLPPGVPRPRGPDDRA